MTSSRPFPLAPVEHACARTGCAAPITGFFSTPVGTFHPQARHVRGLVHVILRGLLAASAALAFTGTRAGEVEVLHFWTSPGEAASIAQLKSMIAERGHTWKDFAVVGGGGQNAMSALRERVQAGNPPAAASIKGPAIKEWAAQGALTSMDAMAAFDHWDQVLPKVVQDQVKYRGRYVAVPVNIHRVNWLWTNTEVLRKSGVATVPTSFDEFLAAAERIRAAGYIPLAQGGQPWQEFVLFETVVLGVAGVDLYRKAFVELDPDALSSPAMKRTLEAFRRLKAHTDEQSRGRDWNVTTDMVIKGRAAFQIMGDWAKGEFLVAGQRPGREFTCSPAPGTSGTYSFVVDAFAMFQLKSWEAQKAQGYLAYALMRPAFQTQFNVRKGSIPVRAGVPMDGFDSCGQMSGRDFLASEKNDLLVPSVSVDMAVPTAIHAALRTVVSEFWNTDTMSPELAMSRLVAASAPRQK